MAVLTSGTKAVAAAGTAETLSTTSVAIASVRIQAEAANTNNVYVGGSTVDSSIGYVLDASQSITLTAAEDGIDELGDVWLDVDTNGEGVRYFYIEA